MGGGGSQAIRIDPEFFEEATQRAQEIKEELDGYRRAIERHLDRELPSEWKGKGASLYEQHVRTSTLPRFRDLVKEFDYLLQCIAAAEEFYTSGKNDYEKLAEGFVRGINRIGIADAEALLAEMELVEPVYHPLNPKIVSGVKDTLSKPEIEDLRDDDLDLEDQILTTIDRMIKYSENLDN